MRLFVAVDLPREAKDILYDIQKKINSRSAKIRWVFKKNLHLTLKFIGEADEFQVETIKKRLENIRFKPFKVAFSEIGFFPSINNARVIWAGLEPARPINELQQKVDEELLTLFPLDQNFQSHVTLGRVKSIKDKKQFVENLENVKIRPYEFEISSFVLFKSQLHKDGPKYTKIAEFLSGDE